jgi:Ca2+-binding EF-hand superfamily protein
MCERAAKDKFYDKKQLCCRCDNGDGKWRTDRCWLHEGEMGPDKDFAGMIRGPSKFQGGGDGTRRGSPGKRRGSPGRRGSDRGGQNSPQEEFKKSDMNGDGKLERWEVQDSMKRSGQPTEMGDVLFDAADMNKDGSVNFNEFMEVNNKMKSNPAMAMMMGMDRDRNGKIDSKEFESMMR